MDNTILSEKRKQDMKELWKDTFHDSNRYIDIVFDTYYSLENTFVKYHENRLISSMLCIPYEFQILTKQGIQRRLRGMYLCGLATRPEWRGMGVMSELMEEAEADIKARGYDMTFLIPANDHLREYYNKKGYKTTSRKTILRYQPKDLEEKHTLETMNIYTIKELIKNGNPFADQLADWCIKIEHSRHSNTILHSHQDMMAIMEENENSIFLTETTFDPEFPILTKVRCVAFPGLPECPEDPLRISELFIRAKEDGVTSKSQEREGTTLSICNYEIAMLDTLLREFNRTSLELVIPYSRKGNKNEEEEPYAMTKILDNNENANLNENCKFEISLMLD